MAKRMLDLFCGRFGWSKAFAARGWECVGIDLVEPPEIPDGCEFVQMDILHITTTMITELSPDFICANSPCEQFSVHGMKHFFPDPKYPEIGIALFNHARAICEASGVPYVMENVRAAQSFVGNAVHHCGPFYLWGPGVPPLMPQGISKGVKQYINPVTRKRDCTGLGRRSWSNSDARLADKAISATIPIELANTVCDYAERIREAEAEMAVA